MCDSSTIKKLEPLAVFGFDGQTNFGLSIHPDRKHIMYPLGTNITITMLGSPKQEFLSGHTNTISCVDISICGKYAGSGQNSHVGFQAYTILWDLENRKEISRHDIHKASVQAVVFTGDDKNLISLGGQDDGTIVVYNIEAKKPFFRVSATNTTSGKALILGKIKFMGTVFLSAGDRHLRVWKLDCEKRRLTYQDVNVGKLQRTYTVCRVDEFGKYAYIGTMSGDLIKVILLLDNEQDSLEAEKRPILVGCYARHNPKKLKGKDCEKYGYGIRCIYIVDKEHILIGTGDGTIELVIERNENFKEYKDPVWPGLKMLHQTRVNGSVTSFAKVNEQNYLIGTDKSEIYQINTKTFEKHLVKSCHKSTIYDIAFPKNYSKVFATAGEDTIRFWSIKRQQELLRIIVQNFTAASIVFAHDGKSLISGWNDGVLRAFTPVTGRLIFAIPNAHNKGCSAVTISVDGKTLASGGYEGQVRIWKITPTLQTLVGVLKEHAAPISCVDFNNLDTELVSACSDGSCVIWDIARLTRKRVLYANTQFLCARYYPTGVQILTCGTDRKISYWEAFDGSLARTLEGFENTPVNRISMNKSGKYFVSVGNDQTVKLWDYHKGVMLSCGAGHSAPIISCAYSPCGKFLISGSSDGAVIIWMVPQEFWPTEEKVTETEKIVKNGFSKSKAAKIEKIEQLDGKQGDHGVLCSECPISK